MIHTGILTASVSFNIKLAVTMWFSSRPPGGNLCYPFGCPSRPSERYTNVWGRQVVWPKARVKRYLMGCPCSSNMRRQHSKPVCLSRHWKLVFFVDRSFIFLILNPEELLHFLQQSGWIFFLIPNLFWKTFVLHCDHTQNEPSAPTNACVGPSLFDHFIVFFFRCFCCYLFCFIDFVFLRLVFSAFVFPCLVFFLCLVIFGCSIVLRCLVPMFVLQSFQCTFPSWNNLFVVPFFGCSFLCLAFSLSYVLWFRIRFWDKRTLPSYVGRVGEWQHVDVWCINSSCDSLVDMMTGPRYLEPSHVWPGD